MDTITAVICQSLGVSLNWTGYMALAKSDSTR
jgi:hypothetical protein